MKSGGKSGYTTMKSLAKGGKEQRRDEVSDDDDDDDDENGFTLDQVISPFEPDEGAQRLDASDLYGNWVSTFLQVLVSEESFLTNFYRLLQHPRSK